ncbi:MAG: hypothetical protein ABJC04_03360 [Verrucomicrobiota bacterium]
MKARDGNKTIRYQPDLYLTAEAVDPVLEVFKCDLDFTLTERNLKLTTEERAQQLTNATRFLSKFRPLVKSKKA